MCEYERTLNIKRQRISLQIKFRRFKIGKSKIKQICQLFQVIAGVPFKITKFKFGVYFWYKRKLAIFKSSFKTWKNASMFDQNFFGISLIALSIYSSIS